jgi:hypothetical protein
VPNRNGWYYDEKRRCNASTGRQCSVPCALSSILISIPLLFFYFSILQFSLFTFFNILFSLHYIFKFLILPYLSYTFLILLLISINYYSFRIIFAALYSLYSNFLNSLLSFLLLIIHFFISLTFLVPSISPLLLYYNTLTLYPRPHTSTAHLASHSPQPSHRHHGQPRVPTTTPPRLPLAHTPPSDV